MESDDTPSNSHIYSAPSLVTDDALASCDLLPPGDALAPRNDDHGEEDAGRTSKRRKILHSLVVYMAGFDIAFSACMIGPSLLDLEQLTDSDPATIAMVFSGRGCGSLTGNILAGLLFDKINNWSLLGMSKMLGAVFTALIPICHNVPQLITCAIPAGVMNGFADAGCFVMILTIWGRDNGPWMLTHSFIYNIGAMISPLVVKPFLQNTSDGNEFGSYLNYTTVENNTTGVYINTTDRGSIARDAPRWMLFNAFIIASTLMLGTCLASFAAFITSDRILLLRKSTASATRDTAKFSLISWMLFLSCAFLFTVVVVGLESGIGAYLMTFSVRFYGWSKSQGAFVTFTFLGAFTVGSGICIFVIKCLGPTYLLLGELCICVLFSIILAVCVNMHEVVLWVSAVGIGVGASSIFATLFSWTELYVGANAKVSGIILAGCGVGDMAIPTLIGVLMDKVSHISFVYVVLTLTASGLLLMCFLMCVVRKMKRVINQDVIKLEIQEKQEAHVE